MILRLGAQAVSYLLHPLWLPTVAMLMVIWALPEHFHDIRSWGVVKLLISLFINTFFFPVFTVLMLRKLNFLKSIHLREQKERFIPYLATSFFYSWAFLALKDFDNVSDAVLSQFGASLIRVIVLAATLSVYLAFFLNILMKVSMHTIGMGCLFGVAFIMLNLSNYDLIIPFMGVILVGGIVGSARIKLGAHNAPEIYGGFLIGLLSLLIAFSTM